MAKRRVALFFLIDALGWEWLRNGQFLNDLAPFRRPTKTVLGFSCSAIPSILTGKYPQEHGRWNLLYYSPRTSPFAWTKPLRFLPDPLLENRFSRKAINVISKKLCGADGYFSSYGLPADKLYMFDICEKKNIYLPGAITGSRSLFDCVSENGIPYRSYSYHSYSDAQALDELTTAVGSGDETVYFTYLAELDDYLHHHCHEPEKVADKLHWYENELRRIIERGAAVCDEVRFFIFSDHGMTPITRHFDLIGALRDGGVLDCEDLMAVYDSTMARFWFTREATAMELEKLLSSFDAGHILSVDELQQLRVYFPDGRYGNLIYLMNPGTLIFPNLFGSYSPQGMHGFHPDDIHSYGSYLSNVDEHSPDRITDLYAIMCREALRTKAL